MDLRRLTDPGAAKLAYTKKNTSSFYLIFKSSTNIYSGANSAKAGSNADSNAMYTVRVDTTAKIISIENVGSFTVVAKVSCGNKTGYVYIGKVSNQGVANYTWTEGPFVQFGMPNSTYKAILKNAGISESSILSGLFGDNPLTNGNQINENRLISKGSDESGEESSDSSTSSAISATNSNANGSAESNDIDVTYEYAIKINPPYAWNIGEHLGGAGSDIQAFDPNNESDKNEAIKGFNYSGLRNVFGIPYQFLPTTDCRVSSNFSSEIERAGYEFSEKIVARLPLLYITPGNSSFMGGSKEEARTMLIGSLGDNFKSDSTDDTLMESSLETMLGEYNGKLYTIMPAYTEYFSYVNPLCRSGAIFLNIAGTSFDSTSIKSNANGTDFNSASFANMNWGVNEGIAYEIWEEEEDTLAEDVEDEDDTNQPSSEEEENTTEETDQEETEPEREKFNMDYSDWFVKGDIISDLGRFQKNLYYSNAIAFYINSDSSFQDSFANETSESSLSSTINTLSDKARELQFLLGTAKGAVGEAFDKVDGTLSAIKEQINDIVKNVAGGNTIFTTIANSVKTIVSGGRLLFPQIWSNSTFSKSYSISIKLTTPNTDRVSWFLDIYVPLCHLMALVLPRSEYVNSYTTPFIIKAFYKGMFNIDMGIITEMTFTKGKEGSWTKDSLPTVVDVSFTIQDLYSAMGMTSTESMFKGFTLQNVAEMDYIANLCGININEPDTFRMVNLWCAFNITDRVYDFIPNLSMGMEQFISTGIINAYNNFWT